MHEIDRRRRLSGIQPSGALHYGNYEGAMKGHIAKQRGALYFLADYHALTTIRDPRQLRANTFDAAAAYMSFGLNEAVLFRQSDVPEVTEIAWLLATVTGKGLLDRATSYKDKVQRGIEPNLGLFFYPVLMAADILAYDSDIVPVGPDQRQHVELTRDMARSFNSQYGEVFRIPDVEIVHPEPVPGLDGRKMSKSYGNTIPILGTSKEVERAVKRIVTDGSPLEAPKDPTTCTVARLVRLLAPSDEVEALEAAYRAGGFGYGHAKAILVDALEALIAPARARYAELQANPDLVEARLQAGARTARGIAQATLRRARQASGLPMRPC